MTRGPSTRPTARPAPRRPDRYALLGGPYRLPVVRRGGALFCEARGAVRVGGYSDGPIPWPKVRKTGSPSLVLCGDLVAAVRRESAVAVAHHFGVSRHTVRNWRRALGVRAHTEGTARLQARWAVARDDDRLERARAGSKTPAALAKASASLAGRVQHPNTVEAVRWSPGGTGPPGGTRCSGWPRRSALGRTRLPSRAQWRERGRAMGQSGHDPIRP